MSWRQPMARGALLLMEALWAYGLVVLIASLPEEQRLPSLLGVGAVVIVSYLVSRGLQMSDLDLGVLRIWGMVLSVLLFYAIVRVDFFGDWRLWDFSWADRIASNFSGAADDYPSVILTVPVLWAFWVRGVSRGQDPLMFETVAGSFATGVVVITLIVLLAGVLDAPKAIGYVAVPYVALGLLAIGLTHAARSESEFGRSFSWTWLASILGAIVALSLVAAFFVLVDLGTIADAITAVVRAISDVVGTVLYAIMYAVAWVIFQIVEAMVGIVRWFLGVSEDPPAEQPPPQPQSEEDPSNNNLPGWAVFFGRASTAIAVLAIALGALYLTFARFQKRKHPGELKESTYTEGRLGSDLGNLLGSMFGRLRPALHFGGESDPAKRLYYEMLDSAHQRGINRQPAQTPLELAPQLEGTFGPPTPTRITVMFDEARYGAAKHAPEEVRRLRREWEESRG
jgi:hypothetical protein